MGKHSPRHGPSHNGRGNGKPRSPNRVAAVPKAPSSSPAEQRTIMQNKYIRALILIALLGAGAAAVYTVSNNSQSKGKDGTEQVDGEGKDLQEILAQIDAAPDRPLTGKELVTLTRRFEKLGIADVSWMHPEGASDDDPRDPLVVVDFLHADGDGAMRGGDKQISTLHRTFAVGAGLRKGGAGTLRMEGARSDQPLEPTLMGPGGKLFPYGDVQRFASRPSGFGKLLGQGASASDIFRSGIPGPWSGTENPLTYDDFVKKGEGMKPTQATVTELFARLQKSPTYPASKVSVVKGPGGQPIVVFNDDEEGYPMHELVTELDRYLAHEEEASNGKEAHDREAFVLGFPRNDVVFMGTAHTSRIQKNGAKGGRSVGKISPHGVPPPGVQDSRMITVANLVREIHKAGGKNKK